MAWFCRWLCSKRRRRASLLSFSCRWSCSSGFVIFAVCLNRQVPPHSVRRWIHTFHTFSLKFVSKLCTPWHEYVKNWLNVNLGIVSANVSTNLTSARNYSQNLESFRQPLGTMFIPVVLGLRVSLVHHFQIKRLYKLHDCTFKGMMTLLFLCKCHTCFISEIFRNSFQPELQIKWFGKRILFFLALLIIT